MACASLKIPKDSYETSLIETHVSGAPIAEMRC